MTTERSYTERELLNSGDWACAWSFQETLAHVCQRIAGLVDDAAVVDQARHIAELTRVDMREATRQWRVLACTLEHRTSPDVDAPHRN